MKQNNVPDKLTKKLNNWVNVKSKISSDQLYYDFFLKKFTLLIESRVSSIVCNIFFA